MIISTLPLPLDQHNSCAPHHAWRARITPVSLPQCIAHTRWRAGGGWWANGWAGGGGGGGGGAGADMSVHRRCALRGALVPALIVCARDIAVAQKAGYRLDWMLPIDAFPRTSHVEWVTRLIRD